MGRAWTALLSLTHGPKTVESWNTTKSYVSCIFYSVTGMINNKWCIASVISSLWRKKATSPLSCLEMTERWKRHLWFFPSKLPEMIWTHDTSCCTSAGLRRDLVVLKPPCGNLWCPFRGLSLPLHQRFLPSSMKRNGKIINAFVSPRTSLTHLTPFNKWCPIFSRSL